MRLPSLAKKKVAGQRIWSINPIINLKVSPGDVVPLDNIFLNNPKPAQTKLYHENFGAKYLCICMLPMTLRHSDSSFRDAMLLRDVYENIKSFGGNFKVICVPTHTQAQVGKFNDDDYIKLCQHQFQIQACTPFPHIEIGDHEFVERMARTFGLPEETTYVIVGPMKVRRVVSIFDSDFLYWHGAEAFPFTTERIQQMACEDQALLSAKHDLTTLLSSPARDFVILNDCTKVPISDLQQKTVCLLFYEDNYEGKKRTQELKQVYKAHKDFEVVVVFAPIFGHDTDQLVGKPGSFRSEIKFWKVFYDMPWLAIPFDDPKCRQLWRIFNHTKICNDSQLPKLIILNSEGKFFAENGFQILENTGFKDYPFTGKEVVSTAVTVRGTTLSSFFGQDVELLCEESIYDRHRYLPEIYTFSKLLEAPVVFLVIAVPGFSKFLAELECYHSVFHSTSSKFKVVYVPLTESSPSVDPYMLVSSSEANKKRLISVFTHFFKEENTQNPEGEKFTLALVTFGPFGHYYKNGIIFTTSSEDAHQLFLETFPFRNGEKGYFESQRIALNRKKTDESLNCIG